MSTAEIEAFQRLKSQLNVVAGEDIRSASELINKLVELPIRSEQERLLTKGTACVFALVQRSVTRPPPPKDDDIHFPQQTRDSSEASKGAYSPGNACSDLPDNIPVHELWRLRGFLLRASRAFDCMTASKFPICR